MIRVEWQLHTYNFSTVALWVLSYAYNMWYGWLYICKKNYWWYAIYIYNITTIKTSALDYNGERYLSSIINCVIFRLWGYLLQLLVCFHLMLWHSNGWLQSVLLWLTLTHSDSAGGSCCRLLWLHLCQPLRSMPVLTSMPAPLGAWPSESWLCALTTQYTLANSLEIALYMYILVLLFYDGMVDDISCNNLLNLCVLVPSRF
jgi:hypothetical protein